MPYEEDSGMSSVGGEDSPRGTKQSVDQENDHEAEATILLPKKALGGKEFKVGEEVVLEIVGDHGDELSAKYASEGKADKPANDELDEMSQPGAGNY